MAPQLVIADAPYKTYPGGVIVLRAADWLGPARATLSTEADATSACGTVVRDTQQAASAPLTAALFAAAANTLVIPLGDLPMEEDLTRYKVLVSLKIEGDWDPSNTATSAGGTQEDLPFVAGTLGWYGTGLSFFATNTTAAAPVFQPRLIDQYRIVGYSGSGGLQRPSLGTPWSTYTLNWRAVSAAGTTLEYLIDQIYLVPSYSPGTATGWTGSDFAVIEGGWNALSGTIDLSNGDYVDGADGGDDNGKFTWHPFNIHGDQTDFISGEGGGDYQQKASESGAEYMVRVIPDEVFVWNTQAAAEGALHCYGLHGPFHIPTQVWTDDDFSRTNGDNDLTGADGHFVTQNKWQATPEGFYWSVVNAHGPETAALVGHVGHRHGRAAWTNGSEGGLMVVSASGDTNNIQAELVPTTSLGGAIRADNVIISGTCRTEEVVASSATDPNEVAAIICSGRFNLGSFPNAWSIVFDLLNKSWGLHHTQTGALINPIHGPVDVSSWFSVGDTFGFRLEIRRYLVRAKVWDASGAEPGAWDYDDFRVIHRSASTTKPYPYQTLGVDDLRWSVIEGSDIHGPSMTLKNADHNTFGTYLIFFDNIVVEHDAGGTAESAYASIRQPDEGTVIGEVEMPDCQHLVYWGTRDWTTLDLGNPFLDFSIKCWNEIGAAELQRSEAVWLWFRSVHGGIISMNWRSSNRYMSNPRVLVGT